MKRFLAYDHVLVSPTSARFAGPADEALAAQGLKRRVALSVPGFDVIAAWHARSEEDPAHGWLRSRLETEARRVSQVTDRPDSTGLLQ